MVGLKSLNFKTNLSLELTFFEIARSKNPKATVDITAISTKIKEYYQARLDRIKAFKDPADDPKQFNRNLFSNDSILFDQIDCESELSLRHIEDMN